MPGKEKAKIMAGWGEKRLTVAGCVSLLLVLCAVLSAVSSHAELIDRVVATVDDYPLTFSELHETYERTKKLQPDITVHEVLNTMINRRLLLNDAKRLKIEAKTEEEVLNEYMDFKVRAYVRVREEEIEDYYRKNEKEFGGAAYETVRDKIEEFLMEKEVNKLLKKQVGELRGKSYVKILFDPSQ